MRLRMGLVYLTSLCLVLFAVLLSSVLPARPTPSDKPVLAHNYVRELARPPVPVALRSTHWREAYGNLPLSFEANLGQADPQVRYTARGPGYSVSLTEDKAVVTFQKMDRVARKRFEVSKYYRASPRFWRMRKTGTVRIGLDGAVAHPGVTPVDELPGKSNYFVGSDPSRWRQGVPNYGKVKYSGIYPGIDLIFYGSRRQLEFDFVVAPGADQSAIALHIETPGRLILDTGGNLRMETTAGFLELHRPEVYQFVGGRKVRVEGRFVLRAENQVGFELGPYDHSKPLTVDPILGYSTYVGGGGWDESDGIAVDAYGNAYIVGYTTSTNFPVANGYASSGNSSGGSAFVAKINSTGTALLYSTYLGGSVADWASGVALDPAGNVYVCGSTLSPDFPVVNGFQTALGTANGNGFIARIDTPQTGASSLVYSTYIGGGGNRANWLGDVALGIAVDASGHAYVTGKPAPTARRPLFRQQRAHFSHPC